MFGEDALVHSEKEGFIIDHSDPLLVHVGEKPFLYGLRKLYDFVHPQTEFFNGDESILIVVQNFEEIKEGNFLKKQGLSQISDDDICLAFIQWFFREEALVDFWHLPPSLRLGAVKTFITL